MRTEQYDLIDACINSGYQVIPLSAKRHGFSYVFKLAVDDSRRYRSVHPTKDKMLAYEIFARHDLEKVGVIIANRLVEAAHQDFVKAALSAKESEPEASQNQEQETDHPV